jgi:hypothetical protein
LIVWVTFLAILAMATHVSIDSDTWWHLKAGEWMVENQQMITEDPFSLTRQGTPWQYPGLWVQVFMYGVYAWFGPGGVNLWVSLMVVLIFWLVWQTTTGNSLVRALVIILAAASSAIYWAARPYLFTYLFGALFFLLLRQYRQAERKTLYLLPLLMVLWVNSHGGFLAGFLFVGPFFVEAGVKWWAAVKGDEGDNGLAEKKQFFHLGIVLVLLFIATILNPQGVTLWELPFTTVSRQAEQLFIAEWQSPDFHMQTLLPFGLLLILTIAVLGGSEKKASLSDILLLSGFGLLSLLSVRNIFFYVIVAPSVLTAHISGILSKWQSKFNLKVFVDFESPPTKIQKIMNVSLVVVVGIVALFRVLLYLPYETNLEEFAMQYPVSAVEFLQEEQPEGNLFNSYNFGGYLIWALPEYPVFVDGRADLHQDEIILTWYSAYNGSEGWQAVFDEWDIGFVVVEPTAPLIKDLKWANWDLLYEDEVAVVYSRPAE